MGLFTDYDEKFRQMEEQRELFEDEEVQETDVEELYKLLTELTEDENMRAEEDDERS